MSPETFARSLDRVTQTNDLILGIDTGGTYTDAVLMDADHVLIAKAKALTTHGELSVGIGAAIEAVVAEASVETGRIAQVSLSTTLATNALVEGQGARAALVMIGFSQADMARAGLGEALGSDPVCFCPGGHDSHGRASPLDLAPLEAFLDGAGGTAEGIAVAACFAVRNPEHEIAAREMIRTRTGQPVTLSHELTASLGGPKRALTTLLNARLVPMVDGLLSALQDKLAERGIHAPVLVVRGDGSLVSTLFARSRPIETILSGPAASVIGARHLTGLDQAIVSDIGGTTTDVAVLDGGRPRLDQQGAAVGGHRTMVEAVAMRTYGLGGDSEVSIDDSALDPELRLGPRRAVPVSLLAVTHGAMVHAVLDKQASAFIPPRHAGRFVIAVRQQRQPDPADKAASEIMARLADGPRAYAEVAQSAPAVAAVERLAKSGFVRIAGFTPSDAAHVTGAQSLWDADAALKAADLFARRRTGRGEPLARSGTEIARSVLQAVTRRTAVVVLETALADAGIDPAAAHSLAAAHAIDRVPGIANFAVTLDRPVIGLGASAGLHYAALDRHFGAKAVVPEDADVANAIGAAVGMVRVSAEVTVIAPAQDLYRVMLPDGPSDHVGREAALAEARRHAETAVRAKALRAGAETPDIRIDEDIRTVPMEGMELFVEATIRATATGRPRLV